MARLDPEAISPTIWYAEVYTRHFKFSAVDVTEKMARQACIAAWDRWCDCSQADRSYVGMDDVRAIPMVVGVPYMDDEPIAREGSDFAEAVVEEERRSGN